MNIKEIENKIHPYTFDSLWFNKIQAILMSEYKGGAIVIVSRDSWKIWVENCACQILK